MRRDIIPAARSADYTPSAYREALDKMGVVVSYTKGVSMRPLIWSGQHYVSIVPVAGEPKIGDMLLFEQIRRGSTACILHRMVAVERLPGGGTIYVTRGDNCLGVERISREDIIGKVEAIYRPGGWRPWHALRSGEVHATDRAYLRYVKAWSALWPVRRMFYEFRAWFYGNAFSQKVLKPIYRMLFK